MPYFVTIARASFVACRQAHFWLPVHAEKHDTLCTPAQTSPADISDSTHAEGKGLKNREFKLLHADMLWFLCLA